MQYFFLAILIISLYMFLNNIFSFVFSLDAYKLHKKRLKELDFDSTKKSEEEMKELIDKATKPFITYIIPKIKIKNLRQIEKDLKMAKWDKNMTPIQYVALNIMSKTLGIVVFLLLYNTSLPIALIWGLILFMSVSFLMNNSAKNRREKLMIEFPDFIRITQGYLSANIPFAKAIEESIKFTGSEWQPILRDFVITNNLSGMDAALAQLREEIDVFEVKEFISVIRLTLEQGVGAREGFESQAEKIQGMLQDILLLKINKRKIMGILIQGPLLICNIVIFGLPVADAFMNLGI